MKWLEVKTWTVEIRVRNGLIGTMITKGIFIVVGHLTGCGWSITLLLETSTWISEVSTDDTYDVRGEEPVNHFVALLIDLVIGMRL